MTINPPDHYLIFDGQNLGDWGLHISGDKTFGAPERDVDEVEVPGRNGTLTYDNGRFKNYTLEYDGGLVFDTQSEFEMKCAKIRSFLCSRIWYKRLEDTYHQDEYRMAKFVDGFDPDVVMLQGGTFTLEFDCKPQRFLKEGEIVETYTASGSIHNPTDFIATPLIRTYGSGKVEINGNTLTIKQPSSVDYVDIDCDLMDCFSGALNCNDCVTISEYTFPTFEPGVTTIGIGKGITKVEITPRWYTI